MYKKNVSVTSLSLSLCPKKRDAYSRLANSSRPAGRLQIDRGQGGVVRPCFRIAIMSVCCVKKICQFLQNASEDLLVVSGRVDVGFRDERQRTIMIEATCRDDARPDFHEQQQEEG